jgi:5,10-methylenetetrahydrofolate reductase
MNSTSSVSFEFFPPNTPVGAEKLKTVVQELGAARPEFFSVTFGAGGSTREKTFSTVTEILAAGYDAAPHFSCIGATRQSVLDTLAGYKAAGIKRLVAIRGDLPSGMAGTSGDFTYADELVRFVRETQGEAFHIEVAAYPEVHPQSRSATRDLDAFCGKLKAGAHSAITQFFFNADAYFYFRDQVRARGFTHRAGRNADSELQQNSRLLRARRHRHATLDCAKNGKLRGRSRKHRGLRPGRGQCDDRAAGSRRCAQCASLHHEPEPLIA